MFCRLLAGLLLSYVCAASHVHRGPHGPSASTVQTPTTATAAATQYTANATQYTTTATQYTATATQYTGTTTQNETAEPNDTTPVTPRQPVPMYNTSGWVTYNSDPNTVSLDGDNGPMPPEDNGPWLGNPKMGDMRVEPIGMVLPGDPCDSIMPGDQVPLMCYCRFCKGAQGPKGDQGFRGIPGT